MYLGKNEGIEKSNRYAQDSARKGIRHQSARFEDSWSGPLLGPSAPAFLRIWAKSGAVRRQREVRGKEKKGVIDRKEI